MTRAAAVDLAVNVYGTSAVEFTLRVPHSEKHATITMWVTRLLWLLASFILGTWLTAPEPTAAIDQLDLPGWLLLRLGVASVALALLISSISGAAVIEESALVMPALGVQLRKRSRSGAETVRFLDRATLSAVVVNEAITFSEVVYYLAFLQHDADKMVLAFEHFRPRIAVLQEIFIHTKHALFPDDGDVPMHLPEFS